MMPDVRSSHAKFETGKPFLVPRFELGICDSKSQVITTSLYEKRTTKRAENGAFGQFNEECHYRFNFF